MASTLLKYLLPPQNFEATKIPPVQIVTGIGAPATSTHGFHPAHYQPQRLPFNVTLLPHLPIMIRSHLEVILEEEYLQSVNVSASLDVEADYNALQRFCRRHEINVSVRHHDKEPSVGDLAARFADPVRSIFENLTGKPAITKAQVRTVDNAVKVDRTYETDGKVAILWEDKAIPVFEHHLNDLITRLTAGENVFSEILSPKNTKLSWQGAEGILAKATVFYFLTV